MNYIDFVIPMWGMLAIFGTIFEILISFDYGFITPKYFYEEWKLNWFGSCFMFILMSIFSPIVTIWKLIYVTSYTIGIGIKWLFTVGR